MRWISASEESEAVGWHIGVYIGWGRHFGLCVFRKHWFVGVYIVLP